MQILQQVMKRSRVNTMFLIAQFWVILCRKALSKQSLKKVPWKINTTMSLKHTASFEQLIKRFSSTCNITSKWPRAAWRKSSPLPKLDNHTTPVMYVCLCSSIDNAIDHEYHVLEEANAQQNRSIFDTATSVQSPMQLFDNPSFLNDEKKSTEEQLEEANFNRLNLLPNGELLNFLCA